MQSDSVDMNAFAGRSCVVTGGLGFIGSNLAIALCGAGAKVTVIDAKFERHGADPRNLVPDDGREPAAIAVVETDLADSATLAPVVRDADYVFNLAGQVSHVDSMTDPLFDLRVNLTSQASFLELLRHENPAAVTVYTSTRQIFGKPRYLPVDEDHPVSPADVNGVSKYAAEQLHLLYHEIYGLPACALRLTNVYGPRQRLRDNFQGFLPIFLRRALAGESITVFGEGTQQRDCLHVDDVVECLLLAALAPEAHGEAFNIGNEEHLSLGQIAEEIVRAAGSGWIDHVPWPPDRDAIDIGSYFADGSKAKRLLGWEPRTRFRAGIEATIAFYRSRLDWYVD